MCSNQGPVRADLVVHPCSSLHTWGLIAQLIFTLEFVLLLHCDLQQANTSDRLVKGSELGLLWLFYTEEPEVGGISHLLSQTRA